MTTFGLDRTQSSYPLNVLGSPWHGEAGQEVGTGLIAEDLPDALPAVLRRLKAEGDG